MYIEKNNEAWQTAVTNMTGWLGDHSLEEGPLERQVGRFLENFTENLNQLAAQHGADDVFTRQELAILLAIVFLCPEAERTHQAMICQQLMAISPDDDEVEDEACLDLVIAYGCGWGREVATNSENGEERWPRAIFALRILVEGSLHHTFKLIIPLLPYKFSLFSGPMREWGRLYSNVITLELLHDRCRCGKHKQGCKKKGDGYACGRECCRDEHRLSGWQPEVCSLQAFVAQGIRGNASSQLKTGALATSMLYPLLNEDSGVTVDSVEFKICGSCSDTAVLKTIAQHKEPKGQGSVMYEGNTCPECDTPANRQTTYHKARKNWILIPYELGGAYEMINRWRCPRCRNLFPITLAACPLCDSPTPQRKTTIWVYSPWLQYSDGEEDLR
jgi:hypothetical protein